jgi:hypothetical protein
LLLVACGNDGTTWLGSNRDAAIGGPPADFFARYEAESPLNTLTFPVENVNDTDNATCPDGGVKEGVSCASGGGYVEKILGRSPCEPPTSASSFDNCQNIGGGVQFNQVSAPVAGTYDVTWWYHCGEDPGSPGHANVYGDKQCGGLDYGTGANSGCRSHLIDVNGVPIVASVSGEVASYFHFPCYPSPWAILHGATTALPLQAGANVIYIHAPGETMLDAVDIDAIDVQPAASGVAPPPLWPKLVTPVPNPD